MHGALFALFLLPQPSEVEAALEHASARVHWFENRGQYPEEIRFGMWVQGAWVGLAKDKIVLHAIGPESGEIAEVGLRFEGARASEPVGMGLEPLGVHHLYLGNDPAKWVTGVRTFASVRLVGLYEGIDLEIAEREEHLEYDLYLEGGADLSRVVVSVQGATGVRLEEGELVLDTPAGELRQLRPVSWQVTPEGRQAMEVRYRTIDATRFGFEEPQRDPTLPLVIDPELTWSTYWGGVQTSGSIGDSANDVVLDEDGYVYVAGTVEGVGSLMTPGTFQAFNGLDDIFVAKLEQATGKVVYSARIGSSGIDKGMALDVDQLGRVTVVGWAGQGASNFPTTPGAFDPTKTSTNDSAVVFRLSSDGGTLQYSTYLESDLGCRARTVKVAASGSAILAGEALGDNFPTTVGSFNPEGKFGPDVFVTRLDPTGSSLEWSTYLASAGFAEAPLDMALDDHEHVIVVGYSGGDWPVTTGAFQTQWAGKWDGFVTKLSSDGSSLVWSTLLGGQDSEQIYGIDIFPDGDVAVCGWTESQDFPISPGAFQTALAGGSSEDAFLARLDSAGSILEYSTYFGGSGDDGAGRVHIDASGLMTVVGAAGSPDFPITPGAFDESLNSTNAFVSRFPPDWSSLLYSTFLGDTFADGASAVTANPGSLVTLVGHTMPPFVTTLNALFPNPIGGQSDSFITTFELLLEGVQTTGTSVPACLGPLNANATTMPLAGQPFGLYCSQAPPNAHGILIAFSGDGPPSVQQVQSGPEGYVETSVGNLPNTPGKLLFYRYAFRNPPGCPGPTLISTSNWVVIQVQ